MCRSTQGGGSCERVAVGLFRTKTLPLCPGSLPAYVLPGWRWPLGGILYGDGLCNVSHWSDRSGDKTRKYVTYSFSIAGRLS